MPDNDAAFELLRQAAADAKAAREAGEALVGRLTLLEERAARFGSIAEANHKLLHGNGEEGIKGRMSHVERTAKDNGRALETIRRGLDDLGDRLGQRRATMWEVAGKVAVGVITAIATVWAAVVISKGGTP